jgi:hypothetical protein
MSNSSKIKGDVRGNRASVTTEVIMSVVTSTPTPK